MKSFFNNLFRREEPVVNTLSVKESPKQKVVHNASTPSTLSQQSRRSLSSCNSGTTKQEHFFDPKTYEFENFQRTSESSIHDKVISDSFIQGAIDASISNSKEVEPEGLLNSSKLFGVEDEVLSFVEPQFANQKLALPLELNNNTLTVLCSSKTNQRAIESHVAAKNRQVKVKLLIADEDILRAAIDHHYLTHTKAINEAQRLSRVKEISTKIREERTQTEKPRLIFSTKEKFNSNDAAIRQLIELLICDAHWRRATDVDIDFYINNEPDQDGVLEYMLCSIRVDGEIRFLHKEPINLEKYNRIPHILKILAELDPSNVWDGQSGVVRSTLTYATRESQVEFRVNFIPPGNDDRGESISIRIQEKDNFPFSLYSIGLLPEQEKLIHNDIMYMSSGMGLIAAPINKGKNSTLVCLLQEIHKNHPTKKIITIEDPIEFNLPGITQISVNRDRVDEIGGKSIKRGFNYYLQSILRHNPDILSIGEIRESESAAMAIEAAGIGHLMLSTVHTKSALETITRLRNLQIEDYKIAASLGFVISQRLVRKNCNKCTVIEDTKLPEIPRLMEYLEKSWNREIKFSRASGYTAEGKVCSQCNGSGYYGRTGIFEILILSNKVKELIAYGAKPSEIQSQVLREGFKSLWMNGLRLVMEGVTTLSEVTYHLGKPDPKMEGLSDEFDTSDSDIPKFDLDDEKSVC